MLNYFAGFWVDEVIIHFKNKSMRKFMILFMFLIVAGIGVSSCKTETTTTDTTTTEKEVVKEKNTTVVVDTAVVDTIRK